MRSKKILISIFCLIVLVILSIHVYVSINENESVSVGLPIVLGIIFIPLIIAFIISAFKQKLFHPTIWVVALLEVMLFVMIFYFVDDSSPKYLEQTNNVEKYFKKKAGFFTRYTPILIFYDDNDSINNINQHRLKIVYRLGTKKIENIYIGKVLINENNKITKEFYNQKAITDTQFLNKEFGKTFSQLIDISELLPHNR